MLSTVTIRASLIAFAGAMSISAYAFAERPKQLDVPAGELTMALKKLAEQSGAEFIYSVDQLKGAHTDGLHGEYTTENAVTKLLQGTQLRLTMHESGAFLIAPPDAAPTSFNRAEEREPEGRRQSAWERFQVAQVDQEADRSSEAAVQQGGEQSSLQLEEVIVTAQKRKENIKDVPISISVLRGEDLDNSTVEGMTEMLNRVPGVTSSLAVQGSGTQLVVRGVTANGPGGGSSPIAYYLDSVPFGLLTSSIVPDPNVYDLERVEVLRGPQGTLYGASAQNGVVRVLTNDANPDKFEFKGRTSASGTENGSANYRGDLAVNVPIVEGKLAVRAVAGYQNLSGWIDSPRSNRVNDAELRNYRLKINAQPTEEFSIDLSAWQSRSDYGAPSASDENQRRSSVEDESIATDYDVYGLKLGYEFPRLSIASTTSYLEYKNGAGLDLLPYGAPLVLFTGHDADVLSQEFILSSTHDGSWRWSVGGIYRDGEDRVFNNIGTDNSNTSKSAAVFGEATRIIMDGRLELTGGLRYFEDDVTQIENVPGGIRTNSKFAKTSPRAVLTWHPSGNSTVYGSYSEGFRSGFNQAANIIRIAPQFPPLKPDNLKNYEIGAKGDVLGGRFSYDTALFYIDWQDVQQQVAVNIDGIPNPVALNAGSASGLGFEFAVTTRPAEGLQLGVNFSWNDLTADSAVADANGANLFEKGDRLNYSAEYTAGASADYAFSLGANGWNGQFSASANYNSEQVYRSVVSGTRDADIGSSMLIARTSFAVKAPEHWTVTVFVDNINNEESPGVGLFHVADWQQRVRPRTIGLQFDWRL